MCVHIHVCVGGGGHAISSSECECHASALMNNHKPRNRACMQSPEARKSTSRPGTALKAAGGGGSGVVAADSVLGQLSNNSGPGADCDDAWSRATALKASSSLLSAQASTVTNGSLLNTPSGPDLSGFLPPEASGRAAESALSSSTPAMKRERIDTMVVLGAKRAPQRHPATRRASWVGQQS